MDRWCFYDADVPYTLCTICGGKPIIAMMWHVGILLLLPVICNARMDLSLHAWTTEPEKAVWADKTTGLSPEVWSEGMGWYTLVLPELLALLPKTHPELSAGP